MEVLERIKVAALYIKDLQVSEAPEPYNELLDLAETLKLEHTKTSIGKVPGVQEARRLFRAINLDPTKHRPSSEALLRRALKGKSFPKINCLVDIGNWCSLDFLLPICVYDLDKILGTVNIRLGEKAETYLAHNGRVINLHNRYVLADNSGPFGSPITDSVRTAVDLDTVNSLLVIFAPFDTDSQLLQDYASRFSQRTKQFCGGNTEKIEIIKG